MRNIPWLSRKLQQIEHSNLCSFDVMPSSVFRISSSNSIIISPDICSRVNTSLYCVSSITSSKLITYDQRVVAETIIYIHTYHTKVCDSTPILLSHTHAQGVKQSVYRSVIDGVVHRISRFTTPSSDVQPLKIHGWFRFLSLHLEYISSRNVELP